MLRHIFTITMLALLAHAGNAVAQTDLPACLAQLRASAPANRISTADFDRITANAKLVEQTVTARKVQPEFKEFWWDYMAKAVDDERINQGQAVLKQWSTTLDQLEQKYGVDKHVLVAVFGMETNYSAAPGTIPVLDAWLTRACLEGKPMWRANVYASVRMLRDGVVQAEQFKGSWSGAFGMTQFIPTSFEAYAADGDEDGKIDLFSNVADGLASTARYLSQASRWRLDAVPAIEVTVPASIAAQLPAGRETRLTEQASINTWTARGVQLVGNAGLPTDRSGAAYSLFAPVGAQGPVYLLSNNFRAIMAYNNATKYALAVSLIAHRLRGGATQQTPWPTDDAGLSRQQIRQLQTALLQRGYEIGIADGIPGERTRNAIMQEQTKLGQASDGRAGQKTLKLLSAPGGK